MREINPDFLFFGLFGFGKMNYENIAMGWLESLKKNCSGRVGLAKTLGFDLTYPYNY